MPVSNEIISKLLSQACRAPSGGNLQPWRVFVLNGSSMKNFLSHLEAYLDLETPEYSIYPQNLKEPYRSSRFKCGEDMYALLSIARDDREARYAHLDRNFIFFDAPAAIFVYVDRIMGPPQWSDLGMFLQNFMLLAKEAGLDTCPQEAWAMKQESVTAFVKAPDELMLFCGMAIGYKDDKAKINKLRTQRRPFEDWATFVK